MPIDNQELLKRGTPYQERPYLRSQLIAARERDVAESAKAEAARQADAVAERQRIAGVIKAGVDRGRPRQAARLALLAPVGADAAATILGKLPSDEDAEAAARDMPASSTIGTFGTAPARSERERIAKILGHEAAASRFTAATELATTTDLAVADAVAALLMMAVEATSNPVTDLAARHRECGEFGADFSAAADGRSGAERTREMWSAAIASVNQSMGASATDAGPAGSGGLQLDAESLARLAASRGAR